ncbi:unnamed protein product [Rotaria sp. Silwood2]|nr:unnamed protein product [Rotaria sp. Silwood2]
MHIRLLHSVFDSIETDVRSWKSESIKSITDFINHSYHQIFYANVAHIISQISEVLCNPCGGLLLLFASAISASHEIEILENTESLSPFNTIKILKHVMSLAGLFILANSSNFSELEQEKNMPNGGILRQYSIESIIEFTYLLNSPPQENNLDENNKNLLATFIGNPESVLQDIDIESLCAIVYHDAVRQNRNKTGKNIVIIVLSIHDDSTARSLSSVDEGSECISVCWKNIL